MKTVMFAATAALISLMSIAPANAQTVVSTDFEGSTGDFTLSGNVGVTAGAAYVTNAGGIGSAAAQANRFATFGSGNVEGEGSVTSQTFATVAGRTYTLSFDYGVFNFPSQVLIYTLDGLGGGTVFDNTGTSNLDDAFSTFTTTFVGNGQNSVLTFYAFSNGGDNADLLLDNILLVGEVPEPATWAMMIGGIGLAGGAMRRRRANASVSYA